MPHSRVKGVHLITKKLEIVSESLCDFLELYKLNPDIEKAF